jgi:hypothetical protein
MSQKQMQLNGWQRIGVVLSVLWAISGAFWGYNIGYHEGGDAKQEHEECRATVNARLAGTARVTMNDWAKDIGRCDSVFRKQNEDATQTGSLYAALLALLPIPFAWIAVYKSIALLRWIREGFQK